MPFSTVRFPCGEFTPGNDPTRPTNPDTGDVGTTVPSVVIPEPSRPDSVFTQTPPGIPDIPVPGGPRPGSGDPGTPGTGAGGGPPTPDVPAPGAPGTGGPGGPGAGIPGPATGGPGGPGAGIPGPATPGGGGQAGGYKCSTFEVSCGPETQKPGVVRQILRSVTPCPASELANDAGRVTASFANLGGGYDYRVDNLCLNLGPRSRFFLGCVNGPDNPRACLAQGPFTPRGTAAPAALDNNANNNQAGGGAGGEVISNNSIRANSVTNVLESNSNSTTLRAGDVGNSLLLSNSIINSINTKPESSVNINDPNLLRFGSPSSTRSNRLGVFDETYNFFRTEPDVTITLYPNSSYLNIFKNAVAEEVQFFLTKSNTNYPWSEKYFDSLTHEKLIISLREDILTVFNNIHDVGNNKINLENFLDILKNHLIGGTISEFDPYYYTFIYNSQINDAIQNTPILGETFEALQVAMGIFNLSSVNPYYPSTGDDNLANDYKRMRFLLEDLLTNISTTQIDGTSESLYLTNAGISTEQIDSPSSFLNIGDGAGYYLSSQYVDGVNVPLPTSNELSAARYIPPFVKYNLMRLLDADVGITITAKSASANHEFTTSFDPSADLSPMYFILDFNTVGETLYPNSVVNTLSANYVLISDEEAINHSRNYSFNILKVNLDYRDPLVHYSKETSTFSFSEDDFNLTFFGAPRAPGNNSIILRNLPAAIILSPGAGSFHNPYNSRSKIETIEDDYVTRSLNFVPTFEVNSSTKPLPPLNSSNIFEALGGGFFGVYESYFERDIQGRIFTYDPSSILFSKAYYTDGSYSNQQPILQNRQENIEGKFVNNLIKKLTSLSGVEYLTWWDVFRRVPISDLGKLFNHSSKDLIDKLSMGLINGVQIRDVISAPGVPVTGIPDGTVINDDLIIINESDR